MFTAIKYYITHSSRLLHWHNVHLLLSTLLSTLLHWRNAHLLLSTLLHWRNAHLLVAGDASIDRCVDDSIETHAEEVDIAV